MQTALLARVAFLYGVVCFGVLFSWFMIIPRLLPHLFRESAWTVWKEILHTLICVLAVCAGNILFTHFYFHDALSGSMALQFLWWTIAVSIFPIVLMVMFRQMRLMKTYSREAAELNRQISIRPDTRTGAPSTWLPASPSNGPDERAIPYHPAGPVTPNGPDERSTPDSPAGSATPNRPGEQVPPDGPGIQATPTGPEGSPAPGPPDKFLYAEAADNYVKVFYVGDQQLIRSTLKQLEEAFRESPRIFRCHRTYLVNLDKVIHISGNAQGYKLHLEGIGQPIPVSRTLNGQIASLVTRPKAFPSA